MTLTHAVLACIISFSAGAGLVTLFARRLLLQTGDEWETRVGQPLARSVTMLNGAEIGSEVED